MFKKFISRYFPPEKFLKPPHVGISFSDASIKAIFFDKGKKNLSLKNMAVPLEKGIIEAGRILKENDVVEKLSSLRRNFEFPFAFFAIPDELAYVFPASVLVAKGGDAAEGIAFIMEENVPLPLADIIFDFTPEEIVQSGSEYKISAVVAACAKKEVGKFTEVLRKAGFEPIGCLHESQTIAKALISESCGDAIVIVHARNDRIGVYLVKNNLVHFSTLVSILEGDYQNQFLNEYQKFLDYCVQFNAGQHCVPEAILVCGEFDCAKKIVEAFSGLVKPAGNAKLANVWTNVFKAGELPDVPYEKSISFAGSVGAVLSDIA